MLIPEIHAIAGEMFARCRHPAALERPDIHLHISADDFRVRTIGAHVCDGVSEIEVNVTDRGKVPVAPGSTSLYGADLGKPFGLF